MYEEFNQLVQRALCREETAVLELTEALSPLMKNRIHAILPYSREKEDLFSEAKLLLLTCLEDYDGEKQVPFLAYYQRQLSYYLWDEVKKSKRREIPILEGEKEEGLTIQDNLPSEINIEKEYIEREEREELAAMVSALPPRQGQVLELFYYEEMNLSEIAGYLGISYQTVANEKTRAIKKLREKMQEKESKKMS